MSLDGTSPSGRRTKDPPSDFTMGSVLERAQGASHARVIVELAVFPLMVPVLSLVRLWVPNFSLSFLSRGRSMGRQAEMTATLGSTADQIAAST